MKHNALNDFLCRMAFMNVASTLDHPNVYGLYDYVTLYELITGDKAFDDLSVALQEDLGSESDRLNLAEDLTNAYESADYVIKKFFEHTRFEQVDMLRGLFE